MIFHPLAKKITCSALLALLMGCSGYKTYGVMGGFGEKKLANNIYYVYFLGNGYTNNQRSRELALLRSADIALQKKRNYFVIGHKNPEPLDSKTTLASTNSLIYQGQRYYLTSPNQSHIIILFRTPPAVNKKYVYNSRKICQTIAKKYATTCGKIKINP
ncbi:MAG: CC0125/CC1285 family lipoprotein [Alphaproteobacteria bacterium]